MTSSEASEFFNENHIAGNRGQSIRLGFFDGAECFMAMSFGKPFRSKQYEWEIVRMSAKIGYTVIGGASRLFKKFLSMTQGSVMTYADLRFGTGKVYETLGMSFVKNTGPGYFYFGKKGRVSRHQFQKQTIQDFCENYDPECTEFQNAAQNFYTQYWDCGNAVYELKR